MPQLVRICAQSELPAPGQLREFTAEGRAFCVANLDGDICVLDGVCPHEGGPLGEGSIEDGRVVCPWHSIAFDLHTGNAGKDSDLHATVFPAKVESGELRAEV